MGRQIFDVLASSAKSSSSMKMASSSIGDIDSSSSMAWVGMGVCCGWASALLAAGLAWFGAICDWLSVAWVMRIFRTGVGPDLRV